MYGSYPISWVEGDGHRSGYVHARRRLSHALPEQHKKRQTKTEEVGHEAGIDQRHARDKHAHALQLVGFNEQPAL